MHQILTGDLNNYQVNLKFEGVKAVLFHLKKPSQSYTVRFH